MDSRLIEYFLRVAELGSINKAATDLRLSQPALSRHIALLEHQLRAKLFTRTQGGVQLTEAGTLLVERARPILRQLTWLVEQVGDRAAGQLAIGIAPSWRNLFTSNFVARLVADYPRVRLRVHEGVSHELRDVMHAGMLDLAAVLSLRDTATADRLLRESPAGIQPGTLQLMAKRNDVDAVMWLLAHGADPNAKWAHRDSEVTPLHLAASQGHAEVVRLLLDSAP